MGAAVLVLAVTGLAWGQKPPQPGGPALVGPGETTVTVEEPGKPGEVCKILKSWKKRDGAWVHQVQSLRTGEMLTIEESAPAAGPPGSRLRASARRVFHWGRSPTPPRGAPVPPPETAKVISPRTPAPAAPPTPARPVVTSAQPSGVRPAGVLTEGGPAGTPTVWPKAYATGPVGPGRAPIPTPSVGSAIMNPYETPHVSAGPLVAQPGPQEVYVQGPDGRLRPAAPGAHGPVPAAGPTVMAPADAAPPRRRPLARLFGRDKEGEEIISAPAGTVVSPPHPTFVQGPATAPVLGKTAPVPAPFPPAGSRVMAPADAAPPRRPLMSRLFGHDKDADAAEEIFSAPSGATGLPRPATAQGLYAAPALGKAVPVPAPLPAPARTAAVQAPAPLRPVPAAQPPVPLQPARAVTSGTAAPPAPSAANTSPNTSRPSTVLAPTAPARPAILTGPTTTSAPAPVIKSGPLPSITPAATPVIKSAPSPVIVGAAAKPAVADPVIVNKGSGGSGGPAVVTGQPLILTEPSRPAAKPADGKVTTVVTTTPVVVTPPKAKAVEPAQGPAIITGPVTQKPTVTAANSGSAFTPIGAPRPAPSGLSDRPAPAAAQSVAASPKPTPPAPAPVKSGDWRESWGKAGPAKAGDTAKAEAVAPRPTSWSLPPAKPTPAAPAPAPRADRIVFPKPGDRKPDPLADPASYSRVARHDAGPKPSDKTGATPRSAEGSSFATASAEHQGPPAVQAKAAESSSFITAPAPASAGRLGPQMVQVPETEANAFSSPRPAAPPPPMMVNAFAGSQQPPAGYLPSAPPAPPTPTFGPPPAPPSYALMPRSPYSMPMRPAGMDAATPAGLANAFTPAENARPIPADFGPPQYAANCFSDPGMSGGGYAAPAMRPGRPVPPPVPGYFPPMAPRNYGQALAEAGAAPTAPQLVATLRGALLPSQREWAADRLAGIDWRTNPQVVDALLTAAHDDPAATVRAGCVRSLAKMKVNTVPAVAVVEGLKRDQDPRVRLEAEEALSVLGGGASRNDPGVRPVSASGPGLR
jgi:hypothetical protein